MRSDPIWIRSTSELSRLNSSSELALCEGTKEYAQREMSMRQYTSLRKQWTQRQGAETLTKVFVLFTAEAHRGLWQMRRLSALLYCTRLPSPFRELLQS